MASSKKLLIGCGVAGGVLFIGFIFVVLFTGLIFKGPDFEAANKQAQEQAKKRTSETVGTITDYTESHTGKSYYYNVTFEYEVDGKTYTRTHLVPEGHPTKYPKGGKGQVCYEKTFPENARFARKEDNRVCGQF
jgi:Protein of unknown function (DUF3592)